MSREKKKKRRPKGHSPPENQIITKCNQSFDAHDAEAVDDDAKQGALLYRGTTYIYRSIHK